MAVCTVLPPMRASQAGRSLRHLGVNLPRHRRPGGRCGPPSITWSGRRQPPPQDTPLAKGHGAEEGMAAQDQVQSRWNFLAGTRAQRTT